MNEPNPPTVSPGRPDADRRLAMLQAVSERPRSSRQRDTGGMGPMAIGFLVLAIVGALAGIAFYVGHGFR